MSWLTFSILVGVTSSVSVSLSLLWLVTEDAPHMREIVLDETMDDMDSNKDGYVTLQEYVGMPPPPLSLSHTHTHTHCPFHPPLPHSPLPPSLSSELDTQYAVWFAEDIWPQYERDVADEEPEWLSEEKNHFTTHRFPTHSIAHPFT